MAIRTSKTEKKTPTQTKQEQTAWLETIIGQIQHKNWCGSLALKFEHGVIKSARKEEVLLPPTNKRH